MRFVFEGFGLREQERERNEDGVRAVRGGHLLALVYIAPSFIAVSMLCRSEYIIYPLSYTKILMLIIILFTNIFISFKLKLFVFTS